MRTLLDRLAGATTSPQDKVALSGRKQQRTERA